MQNSLNEWKSKWIQFMSKISPEYYSEYLGSVVFYFGAEGNFANFVNNHQSMGTLVFSIVCAVLFGLYVAMANGGGNLSSAITLPLCLAGRKPWRKFPGYVIAHFLGAITASLVTYWLYYDQFNVKKTNNVFIMQMMTTYPPTSGIRKSTMFMEQFLAAFGVVFGVLAITDSENPAEHPATHVISISLMVGALLGSLGASGVFILVPDLDLAGRIISLIYAKDTGWSVLGYEYFFIPQFSLYSGGLAATIIYKLFIEFLHPNNTQSNKVDACQL
uniref:Aquaglyceroporin n=1 Tax=Dicyema japonicum TaxID=399803 RepID=B9ZYV3_DICJA|nr:aquaglyceroporin [Dicyema japonicum]